MVKSKWFPHVGNLVGIVYSTEDGVEKCHIGVADPKNGKGDFNESHIQMLGTRFPVEAARVLMGISEHKCPEHGEPLEVIHQEGRRKDLECPVPICNYGKLI